jgi:hypothetical protein
VRTTRRRTVAAFGASALLLAVSACSSDDPTGESLPAPADTESAVDATDAPVRDEPSDTTAVPSDDDTVDDPATTTPVTDPAVVVPGALQFTAPLVGGGTFDGAAVAGKPTVFWFWAPT